MTAIRNHRAAAIQARAHEAMVSLRATAVQRVYFTLPLMPVPLHACFINAGRRRVESKRYTIWKEAIDGHLARTRPELLGDPYTGATFKGLVLARYYVMRPDKRARDLDNLLKALNDTLTRNRIIADDSNIVDLGIAWARSEIQGGPVLVEVEGI